MAKKTIKDGTVADAYLTILADRGIKYLFGNPVPAHYISNAENLPTLTVVFNNQMWNAVRRNTRNVYPDGYAAKSYWEPLTYFQEGTRFEKAIEVAGGYGEQVEDPEELPKALDRALNVIAKEDRQAVLNVVCLAE